MTNPGDLENGVLVGYEGYLFLAGGAHRILEVISGQKHIEAESLHNFRANILARRDLAADRKFIHIVFPDKQSVVREHFPIANPLSLGEMYLGHFPELSEIVFFPLNLLRKHADHVYLKTDTHLSDYGILLTLAGLIERILSEPQCQHLAALKEKLTTERLVSGDLGSKLGTPVSSKEKFVAVDWPLRSFHNDLQRNDGIVDIYFSKKALYPLRVLCFGDSFGRSFSRLASYFFSEITFLRTRYFHEEIVDQIQPDIILSENVERYLDFCTSDEERPSFFMLPYLTAKGYNPSAGFAEAFSAVLSYPRLSYRRFVEKLFL